MGQQSQKIEDEENDAVGGQTAAFHPIAGLCLECTVTHTHMHIYTFPPQGECDWIIDSTETDRSQRTAKDSL